MNVDDFEAIDAWSTNFNVGPLYGDHDGDFLKLVSKSLTSEIKFNASASNIDHDFAMKSFITENNISLQINPTKAFKVEVGINSHYHRINSE